MSTATTTEKTPVYTASIKTRRLLDENAHEVSILNEAGRIVSFAVTNYGWTAKLKARKLIRLAQKGVFFPL